MEKLKMNKFKNAWQFLRNHGFARALSQCRYRISELRNDRYFGIDTSHDVLLETLGIHNENSAGYSPISYAALDLALREVEPSLEQGTFLDYGAGKGRVVILAATRIFRRVIGVEFAPELVSAAMDNINRARHRLTCSDIEILEIDATKFKVSADISVIHFYNPFFGATLKAVARNIADSLNATPRKITILFANADSFECILKEEKHIPMEWITKSKAIPWPHFEQDALYSNSYQIYSLDSRPSIAESEYYNH